MTSEKSPCHEEDKGFRKTVKTKGEADVVEHYSWECISVFREKYSSTIDFVIRD